MIGESRDVFTKRLLGENTLAISCVKIQGGPAPPPPCPPLTTPMAV